MDTHLHKEIARLREDLAEANAVIRELRGTDTWLMYKVSFNIVPQAAKILALLMQHKYSSREAIMDVLYHDKIDIAELKIVDVVMTRLRKALKEKCGAHINTLWGIGYEISAENKLKIKKAMEA